MDSSPSHFKPRGSIIRAYVPEWDKYNAVSQSEGFGSAKNFSDSDMNCTQLRDNMDSQLEELQLGNKIVETKKKIKPNKVQHTCKDH
jgi:hypothetical protein